MKTKVFGLIPVVFMMTTLFINGTTVSAGAGSYCGELRLGAYITENEFGPVDPPEGGEVSFHLVDSGGPFFIVHGLFDPQPVSTDPDDKPILFSGTCQVCEDCIEGSTTPILYCNTFQTQWHTQRNSPPPPQDPGYKFNWFDGRMVQFSLDLTTGEGHIWNVGIDYMRWEEFDSGDFDHGEFAPGYAKGTISVVDKLPGCLKRYAK